MKVLLFNFQQPDSNWLGTGGVGVYLSNLAAELLRRKIDFVCLDSGEQYTSAIPSPSLVFSEGPGYRRASIVNSPVIAPSHLNFFNEEEYLTSGALNDFPARLIKQFGNFDVIHLQNIEGLTLGFLKSLRSDSPDTKFIISAHNYNLVCPQVNLWQNEEDNCKDYQSGQACVTCIAYRDAEYMKQTRAKWGFRHRTRNLPRWLRERLLARSGLPTDWEDQPYDNHALKALINSKLLASSFREFRAANAAFCKTVDTVLTTSERSRQILIDKGMCAGNIAVSYIGSRAVADKGDFDRKTDFGENLHIGFIGYARRDKGFYFLLEALRSAPTSLLASLELTVAARGLSEDDIQKLGALKLGAFYVHDGYNSDTLPEILHGVHLGIVPPLWEDNLPQVAIEMVAMGLPILTSDCGGAREIARNSSFEFVSGSHTSFVGALNAIARKEVSLATFWAQEPNIRTMNAHVDDLINKFYQ